MVDYGVRGEEFSFYQKKTLPLFDLFEHPSKLCYTAISEGNCYEYGKQPNMIMKQILQYSEPKNMKSPLLKALNEALNKVFQKAHTKRSVKRP